MKINKKNIVIFTGILVSVVSTWLFARHIEWNLLISAFKDGNYIYMVPAFFLLMVGYVLRAFRWQSLISPIKKVSFPTMFSAISIGFATNHILPARMGEIIRPAFLGKKEKIKISSCLGTVFLERIFDLFGILAFTIVVLIIIPCTNSDNHACNTNSEITHDWGLADGHVENEEAGDTTFLHTLKQWVNVFAGVGVAAIVFLVFLVIYPHKIKSIISKIFFLLPGKYEHKLMEFLDSFLSGLQILKNKWQILWIFLLTLGVWISLGGVFYVMGFSFDLNLPFSGACLVTICIGFAVALPQAPGYIGVFHLATLKTLEIFDIDLVLSQSYAISLWAINIIPITIIGVLLLWKEGIAFKDLSKLEKI